MAYYRIIYSLTHTIWIHFITIYFMRYIEYGPEKLYTYPHSFWGEGRGIGKRKENHSRVKFHAFKTRYNTK